MILIIIRIDYIYDKKDSNSSTIVHENIQSFVFNITYQLIDT